MSESGAVSEHPSSVANHCARTILDSIPFVMRVIRREMRRHGAGLSLAQFRTLVFLDHNAGADLGALAEHLGVTAATASASVERLVQQALVVRRPRPKERRRVQLSLTPKGGRMVSLARQSTQDQIARRLMQLSERDQEALGQAMLILRQLFAPSEPGLH